jgi:hypothetical protein
MVQAYKGYVSPSGSIVGATDTAGKPVSGQYLPNSIVDSSGMTWGISAGGQVTKNGVIDKLTAHVTDIVYVNGAVWQENTSNLWYKYIGNAPGNYDGWAPGTAIPPVPEVLTWVGGGTNAAANPLDWTQHTPPAPGDRLLVNPGAVIHVTGNSLAGQPLSVQTPATTNGAASLAPVTVDVTGPGANFSISGGVFGYGTPMVVNLAQNSQWTGGLTSAFAAATVEAGLGNGSWVNTTTSVYGNTLRVDATVVGVGAFNADSGHGTGTIEFIKGVGAGQTITAANAGYGSGPGIVQLDDVKDFAGTIHLALGTAILENVHATSFSEANGVLSLFNGNALVDSLRISAATNIWGGHGTLAAYQTRDYVAITDTGTSPAGTLLAHH